MHETGLQPKDSFPNTSGFAATHCSTCAAGMKILDDKGQAGVFCLLCREWMTDKHGQSRLTDCSRFEPLEKA